MTGILDRVAKSLAAHSSTFKPASTDEFFALQLARALDDAPCFKHYAELLNHHSPEQLVVACRRAKKNGSHLDPARSFHSELQHVAGHHYDRAPERRLAAVCIERRAIAVVILSGVQMAYPPLVRQLSSSNDKALGSAASLISRIQELCPFITAAFEAEPKEETGQRKRLAQAIEHVLIEQEVGIRHVPRSELLAAFGQPPLRFRSDVREVISQIWPEADDEPGSEFVKDALALGLYCQTDLLFNINPTTP